MSSTKKLGSEASTSLEIAKMEDSTKLRQVCHFAVGKSGMDGVDRAKIDKIIFEASKDSSYFKEQQRKNNITTEKIKKMQQTIVMKCSALTSTSKSALFKRISALQERLEAERDMSRTFIHVDMDMFYAAVEMRDRPELRGKPVAVGGLAMISTSNYEARKYGVRAAMPGFIGKRLCHELGGGELIFVRENFAKYKEAAKITRNVFACYDPNFVSGSLDEACLDVTDYLNKVNQERLALSKLENNVFIPLTGADIASEIRSRIYVDTNGLTASAGVACNRMISKICSDLNKPNGQYVLKAERQAILAFMRPLAIRKIPGIGKVSERYLNEVGVKTCGDIIDSLEMCVKIFTVFTAQNGSEKTPMSYMYHSMGLSGSSDSFGFAAINPKARYKGNEPSSSSSSNISSGSSSSILVPTMDSDINDHSNGLSRKSISTERTFRNICKIGDIQSKCREIVEELCRRIALTGGDGESDDDDDNYPTEEQVKEWYKDEDTNALKDQKDQKPNYVDKDDINHDFDDYQDNMSDINYGAIGEQYLESLNKQSEAQELPVPIIEGKTVTLKLKSKAFKQITVQKSLNHYICSYEDIVKVAMELLNNQIQIHLPIGTAAATLDSKTSMNLRLMGIRLSSLRYKLQSSTNKQGDAHAFDPKQTIIGSALLRSKRNDIDTIFNSMSSLQPSSDNANDIQTISSTSLLTPSSSAPLSSIQIGPPSSFSTFRKSIQPQVKKPILSFTALSQSQKVNIGGSSENKMNSGDTVNNTTNTNNKGRISLSASSSSNVTKRARIDDDGLNANASVVAGLRASSSNIQTINKIMNVSGEKTAKSSTTNASAIHCPVCNVQLRFADIAHIEMCMNRGNKSDGFTSSQHNRNRSTTRATKKARLDNFFTPMSSSKTSCSPKPSSKRHNFESSQQSHENSHNRSSNSENMYNINNNFNSSNSPVQSSVTSHDKHKINQFFDACKEIKR